MRGQGNRPRPGAPSWSRRWNSPAIICRCTSSRSSPRPSSAPRLGAVRVGGEDGAAAVCELTEEARGAAGLPAYEIPTPARPGGECRHNLTYWRYGDFVGVGRGAHGRLTIGDGKVATRQHRAPEA